MPVPLSEGEYTGFPFTIWIMSVLNGYFKKIVLYNPEQKY